MSAWVLSVLLYGVYIRSQGSTSPQLTVSEGNTAQDLFGFEAL